MILSLFSDIITGRILLSVFDPTGSVSTFHTSDVGTDGNPLDMEDIEVVYTYVWVRGLRGSLPTLSDLTRFQEMIWFSFLTSPYFCMCLFLMCFYFYFSVYKGQTQRLGLCRCSTGVRDVYRLEDGGVTGRRRQATHGRIKDETPHQRSEGSRQHDTFHHVRDVIQSDGRSLGLRRQESTLCWH